MGTILKALLQQRHIQTISAFNREYDRVALAVEPDMVGHGPKKAQFYRWLSGNIATLPHPHHCRILQNMFPDWSAEELFSLNDGVGDDSPIPKHRSSSRFNARPPSEIEGIYTNRMEFVRNFPPQDLFISAENIDLAGISLNLLCQHFSDTEIGRLLESGATMRCLFLDPNGQHIRQREEEEGHPPGTLQRLTAMNMQALRKVQKKLEPEAADRICIRTYNATARFNLTIIDHSLCIAQPYLPTGRGVESPTIVARKSGHIRLFETFANVFDELWSVRAEGALDE